MKEKRVRPKISIRMQARVFRRDRWLCHWCHRPVVLGPAMRLLEELVRGSDKEKPLAYYHSHWTRQSAPLLDHLGAVVDHIEAWATGGAHDERNFATSCNKCNTRKNSKLAEAYSKLCPGNPVRGKYGEPTHWDGFSSLFVVLATQGAKLSSGERQWLKELQAGPNE